jgi:hypothetical protein
MKSGIVPNAGVTGPLSVDGVMRALYPRPLPCGGQAGVPSAMRNYTVSGVAKTTGHPTAVRVRAATETDARRQAFGMGLRPTKCVADPVQPATPGRVAACIVIACLFLWPTLAVAFGEGWGALAGLVGIIAFVAFVIARVDARMPRQ